MKRILIIIGAGGHGRVVADIALKIGKWNNIFFLDDDENIKTSMDIEVRGKFEDAFHYVDKCDIFVAIGNNALRKNIQLALEEIGASIPILIHPSAVIGSKVNLGAGTVVMGGGVINSCTEIGKGCIVNTGATIDHDNLIADFAHISPGAHLAGNVSIGTKSWIGIGCVVNNNVKVTSNCIVGAGAVVINDIDESGTYVGIPARRLKNV